MAGKGFASGAFQIAASGQAVFGGYPGGSEALLASMGWPLSIQTGPGEYAELPRAMPAACRLLPAAPTAPTMQPPFAGARGGAEAPAELSQLPDTRQGRIDQNRDAEGLDFYLVGLGADLAWHPKKL